MDLLSGFIGSFPTCQRNQEFQGHVLESDPRNKDIFVIGAGCAKKEEDVQKCSKEIQGNRHRKDTSPAQSCASHFDQETAQAREKTGGFGACKQSGSRESEKDVGYLDFSWRLVCQPG
jgi:hypothetical protein